MEKLAVEQFASLAHPQRLAVFRLLMRRYPTRVPAGAIASALGIKASTLSVYLGNLRSTGLITQEREGTSLTYAADTTAAGHLVDYLVDDCCRGRGALCPPEMVQDRPLSVLFICTGNSARSLIAETLVRDLGQGRFVAHSAGTTPRSAPSPLALAILERRGHDVSALRSKSLDHLLGAGSSRFDFVFTVCDAAANEDCPRWAGRPITAHWSEPDPVRVTGPLFERAEAFDRTYLNLRNRIEAFVALPFETLDRMSLQAKVDELALLEEQK
ncbi:helix-turn-helix domain-containing protein [Marivivens sp. LCG002]|uniref:arsenate reductase/protein-tyrosine-phosphatase family protein n=1 Tax=Marivivens sp. LCG002 TaxID=3051171 RepID=UPI002555668A|nr:helix-turn-helix domain-containing protein [Marivivens sp. LCG002]WIV50436.1 helix-turn-helix domain-containing protein [Marivivens sp. LCG002]